MKRLLLLLSLVLVACIPAARSLDPFLERKPDPIRDQGAHRAPVEWWYLNAHMTTKTGTKGIAAAIFQVYIPENTPYNLASLFPDALYFGHYSIVDKQTGNFQSAEYSTVPRVKPEIATRVGYARTERMDVGLGDWRMTRESTGIYTAKFGIRGRETIDLKLRPLRPEAVHGPGWSGTKETGRMYYTSATRLEISGTYNGEPVGGIAWLDHQWGGSDFGDGSASFSPRWDWMSMNLEDGRDVMVYRVRNEKGGIADQFASIVNPDGSTREERDFVMQPWDWWESPAGGRYPVRWFVKLQDGTVLNLKPVVNAQEVEARATTGFNYYEGAIEISGSTRGVGYMELTGYTPSRGNPFTNPFSFLEPR
jgi:predicted secreted hydrolase